VEKILAQYLKKPTLSALSQAIKDHKKDYYTALEKQSKDNPYYTMVNLFCPDYFTGPKIYVGTNRIYY